MSLLETLQLIGYSLGAVLPLWLGYVLLTAAPGTGHSRASSASRLAACMVGWHGGNLIITLRSLLGLPHAEWAVVLRTANTIAVISITLCYSLLLHVHLHLWAGAHARDLNRTERIRAVLSYVPCLFLVFAIPRIWSGTYQVMIAKTVVRSSCRSHCGSFIRLSVCAITELLVATTCDFGQRAAHPAHAGIFVLRHRGVDSVGAGSGSGPRNDRRFVPANVCESWFTAAVCAAGLLHLSLSIPRADYQRESGHRDLRGGGVGGLRLWNSAHQRLGDSRITECAPV